MNLLGFLTRPKEDVFPQTATRDAAQENAGAPVGGRQGNQDMGNVASIVGETTLIRRNPAKPAKVIPQVEYAGMVEMAPSEWASIPENPRQRDTATRARRAKHLHNPHPSHCKVNMARLPDGRCYKLDGHTRSHLWQEGVVIAPATLFVDVWDCRSLESAKSLYSTFDSRGAVETSSDQIFGAMREENVEFNSALLRGSKITSAMRTAYDCLYGNNAAKAISTYDLLKFWRQELETLDTCNPKPDRFHTGITSAALLTLRRYGTQASVFWSNFAQGKGKKDEQMMDAVEALERRMNRRRAENAIQGRANFFEIIGIAISAVERYREGDLYVAGTGTGKGGGIKTKTGNSFREWMIEAKNAKRFA